MKDSPGQFYAYRMGCNYPWHLMFRYQDERTRKEKAVEVAIVDDYQFYEDNINRIWGRYLHEIFEEKEFSPKWNVSIFMVCIIGVPVNTRRLIESKERLTCGKKNMENKNRWEK